MARWTLTEIERVTDPVTQKTQRIAQADDAGRPVFLVQIALADLSWQSIASESTIEAAREIAHLERIHHHELAALARVSEPVRNHDSPWGRVHGRTELAPGIVNVTTASHGGFLLEPETNARVPACLRNAGGAYEEDTEWSKVAFTFPHLFTRFERADARKLLIGSYPDEYQSLTGETVATADSAVLRLRAFYAENGHRYIGLTATPSDSGTVVVSAVIGGSRARQAGTAGPAKRFRVDAVEYGKSRGFGFVIDLSRHPEVTD